MGITRTKKTHYEEPKQLTNYEKNKWTAQKKKNRQQTPGRIMKSDLKIKTQEKKKKRKQKKKA